MKLVAKFVYFFIFFLRYFNFNALNTGIKHEIERDEFFILNCIIIAIRVQFSNSYQAIFFSSKCR